MKAYRENHIEIIDFLRGLAALSVVLFHFSGSTIASIKPNYVTDFFEWGRLGVQVFFVISGFIIPYAMHASSYKVKDFGSFIFRRFLRINPPSYISILLVVGLYYAAIFLLGRPIKGWDWPGTDLYTILGNITYFYEFFDVRPYIDVYWTLEVEFQYYLFMGAFYPVMMALTKKPFWLSVVFLGYATFSMWPALLIFPFFSVSSYFIMGNLLFLYKKGYINREYFVPAIVIAMLYCNLQGGVPYAYSGVIAVLIIAFVRFTHPVTTFLGNISYSLYITHSFAGFAMEIVMNRVIGTEFSMPVRTLLVIPYVLWSILFAWIFYQLFERPFIRVSKKLTSTKKRPQHEAAA